VELEREHMSGCATARARAVSPGAAEVRRSWLLTALLLTIATTTSAQHDSETSSAQALSSAHALSPAQASSASQSSPTPQTPDPLVFTVTVVGTTPLAGVGQPVDRVAAPVQTATDEDIRRSSALDLMDFLNRRMNGVSLNEIQGNPFQADVSYRGYTASPLLGTPQGLSVYMDGVRLNQPFGETVSWDLVPRVAIGSVTLMPGSNPLFGLNTLGGALALETKSGRTHKGTALQATYGSSVRRAVEFEHGGAGASGLHWYLAGNLFGEDGWRDNSPSDVRQFFGKLGTEHDARALVLTVAHADNALSGNGLQEPSFLARDRASVYTTPDTTGNRSTLVTLNGRQAFGPRLSFAGNVYYRHIRTDTLNGDLNEEALDQALYQPSVPEIAALRAAGHTGVPVSGETSANTPFPSWRCIGNVLLNDEPAEKCNALLNRTGTAQHSEGASGQVTHTATLLGHASQLTVGAAFDQGRAEFMQSTQLGYLGSDRGVIPVEAYGDGVTGGEVDGEPFDTRVDLSGRVRTWSAYGAETLSFAGVWHATVSGRFNRTTVDNRDAITPGGGPGSLDGVHVFSRLNPAAGLTYSPSRDLNVYAGYSEGSRAATSIELGCADPDVPCRLPNALAGDPPLDQVVTRTWDAGGRGQAGSLRWHGNIFRADNDNDILFVTSERTGFGYFKNFGKTRRTGVEAGVSRRFGRVAAGGGYTLVHATFESPESVNGESNSSNDEALAGTPGQEGAIHIEPGDRMPLIPRHQLKAFADVQVSRRVAVDAAAIVMSGAFARGNENNIHQPSSPYYLGKGQSDSYGLVNLSTRVEVLPWLQLTGQIDNVFNRRYSTAAQLGPMGFTDQGAFIARPFPSADGEFPVRHSTFYAPGAPRRFWLGTRVTF
jgi:outer membrane receptor protein involved in Fe transport